MFKILVTMAFLLLQLVTISIMCLIIKKLVGCRFRPGTQEEFQKQRNMHYESWKNSSNTAPHFPECLSRLGFDRYPANTDEIKNRYKDLARRCHPDMGGNAEDFRKLKEAYDMCIELPEYRTPQG